VSVYAVSIAHHRKRRKVLVIHEQEPFEKIISAALTIKPPGRIFAAYRGN
jgi:hypothetical protein